MLNHDGTVDDDDGDDDNKGNTADGDGLLAYMAGRSSSAGDIRKVMATKTEIPQRVQVQGARLMPVNRLQVIYKLMITPTTYTKVNQLKKMDISISPIRLTSTTGSDNMMLVVCITRLLSRC
jgi:hypothetical protein